MPRVCRTIPTLGIGRCAWLRIARQWSLIVAWALHGHRRGNRLPQAQKSSLGATMLVTRQPVFRHVWHAVMPLAMLEAGPQPFTLLGVDIVLFLDGEASPRR